VLIIIGFERKNYYYNTAVQSSLPTLIVLISYDTFNEGMQEKKNQFESFLYFI
jgi:hypothetical protein